MVGKTYCFVLNLSRLSYSSVTRTQMQNRLSFKASLRTKTLQILLEVYICGFVRSSWSLIKRLVNELVVNHRKTSLCLGFSSFLFVDTSVWGTRSGIINVASKALLLSSLFSSHSAFTQQPCYIGLFKVPWKCYLLFYLRAIIIDVSSF